MSTLSHSGVVGGSSAPPELIRMIISKLNMRELVVSGGRAGLWVGQVRTG